MKNAKTADKKKDFNGKIAGLTVLEALFYILSLPLIVILSLVFCIKTYELVPYYSFWPFVGVLLAGVLCLVFVIVVMCVSMRKKSKRTILMQTVSIIVAALMLTSFIAVLLDVVLPDVLAYLTANTLFYEDLSNETLASEQAEFNAELDRKFIMMNLLNGNYSSSLYYDDLKVSCKNDAANEATTVRAWNGYSATEMRYRLVDRNGEEYAELYDFIYQEYIMTDTSYALLAPDVKDENGDSVVNSTRMGMAIAITDAVISTYKNILNNGGMTEPRIAELYANNYASLKNDGYLTYDDCLILYATSGRMTVPVVIRLLLDANYTYTEDQQAYIDENGNVVEPEGTFYLELYEPEEVDAVIKAGAVKWNEDETKGVLIREVEGVNYGVGAVIIPNLDEEGNIVSGGYIRAPRKWSILDMDGKNMEVATIADVPINLGAMLSDMGVPPNIMDMISRLLQGVGDIMGPTTVGNLLGTGSLNSLLNTLFMIPELSGLVDSLLQGITDVIMTATGGAGLYLNLAINDSGDIEIAIAPTNVEVGMYGYQYMTWMESNSLLFAVMSVMSLREWLYIFGAVSVIMAFAAGMCREIKARVKKDVEENARLAAETATGEDVDANDADANYVDAATYGAETATYGADGYDQNAGGYDYGAQNASYDAYASPQEGYGQGGYDDGSAV